MQFSASGARSTHRRATASGASRPLWRIPAIVSYLNLQRALSLPRDATGTTMSRADPQQVWKQDGPAAQPLGRDGMCRPAIVLMHMPRIFGRRCVAKLFRAPGEGVPLFRDIPPTPPVQVRILLPQPVYLAVFGDLPEACPGGANVMVPASAQESRGYTLQSVYGRP